MKKLNGVIPLGPSNCTWAAHSSKRAMLWLAFLRSQESFLYHRNPHCLDLLSSQADPTAPLFYVVKQLCRAEACGPVNSAIIPATIQKGFPHLPVWPAVTWRGSGAGASLTQQPRWVPRRKRVRTEVLQAKNTWPGFQKTCHKAFRSNLFCPPESPRNKTYPPVILLSPLVRTQKSDCLNQTSQLWSTLPA